MPAEDVSDLREVVDAINRLCENMKTSYDEEEPELVPSDEAVVRRVENYVAEKWSDSVVEEVSDTDQLVTVCEPISEYYTASSEVSLLSDEMCQPDKEKVDRNYASSEVSLLSDELAQFEDSDKERDDRNSVMAGHVAAMRERFESMTRTSTPCPDVLRSASPGFDILFRNITPSPDQLDKS
ncbi:uncharacterized protein LOC125049057 [Pieris napi]|uniref:uncharacterized protein LOC125049057 n=1 Tax=Pieris napi TaxID=78633 RepID=UPI001FBC02F2|nr:uncharacterized protein LOC125049057 [Pieris napi]